MSLSAPTVTVGFDIGGTNMRAAVVAESGKILDTQSIPTPRTQSGLERGIKELVTYFDRSYSVAGVGVAVAGFLDPECETVRFAPHLSWRNQPVRAQLEELLQVPVILEHDANAAAWGEYAFGGAQQHKNWVFFALGTGIGATLMIDGEIYRGAFGTAPEFGHICVVPQGRKCACGKRGCLERYCSGTALVETAKELLAHTDHDSSLLQLGVDGCLTGKAIMLAAHNGDELAQQVVADFARWLGHALSTVVDILDPELILIGGGVSGGAELYLDAAREYCVQNIVGSGYRPVPEISCATLGDEAGMIGVADLARKRQLS
ncbi:ROK family glucokinase [Corynebacterium sp. sy017]|uniref:ROK family glucokinase n=1 Tax=unclassified Corynebacterium TaxID=2624378 RepID=UPI0011870F24|nr:MULTISPECIES: ROK family glucokinase [unclassified Corynebacterium]MBP3087982.1 ROK family glucokinase [Corynebacterium sp. sy017]QDZ42938.1 ROK family glucokinase [Corynebacterium sp. sy039]TSD92512.1 ROK family glucokinase [Corynebacterium sp. SY003]